MAPSSGPSESPETVLVSSSMVAGSAPSPPACQRSCLLACNSFGDTVVSHVVYLRFSVFMCLLSFVFYIETVTQALCPMVTSFSSCYPFQEVLCHICVLGLFPLSLFQSFHFLICFKELILILIISNSSLFKYFILSCLLQNILAWSKFVRILPIFPDSSWWWLTLRAVCGDMGVANALPWFYPTVPGSFIQNTSLPY